MQLQLKVKCYLRLSKIIYLLLKKNGYFMFLLCQHMLVATMIRGIKSCVRPSALCLRSLQGVGWPARD